MAWSRLLSCLAPFLAEISLLVLLLEMDLRLETVSKGVIGGNIKGGMKSHKIVVTARFEWKKRFFCCLFTPSLLLSAIEYFFYIVCLKAFLLFESSLSSSPVSRWVPKKELNKCRECSSAFNIKNHSPRPVRWSDSCLMSKRVETFISCHHFIVCWLLLISGSAIGIASHVLSTEKRASSVCVVDQFS